MNSEVIKRELKRICALIGQTPSSKEAVTFFCDYFKDYDERDFVSACHDRELLKALSRERLGVITIEDFVFKHRMIRIEKEAKEKKDKIKEETEKFFKTQDIPEEVKKFIATLKKI